MNLENVQVGDVVCIETSDYYAYLATVTKITKTLVIVGHCKFNKNGEVVPNDAWSRIRCYIPNSEDVLRIRNKQEVKKLNKKLEVLLGDFRKRYANYSQDVYDKITQLNLLISEKNKNE